MIPRDLLEKYNLPADQAATAIEQAVTTVLSPMFNMDIHVRLADHLEIYAFSKTSHLDLEPAIINPATLSKQVQRQIRHRIEQELEKRQAIHEGELLRSLRGQVVRGEVRQSSANGDLPVLLEIPDQLRTLTLTGTCPKRHLPPKERGRLQPGRIRAFLVTSVLSVQQQGRYKVQVRLSRTTMALPEKLLQRATGIDGIRCTKRIAGAYSEIESPKVLPRDAIKAASRELQERISVRVLSTKKSA